MHRPLGETQTSVCLHTAAWKHWKTVPHYAAVEPLGQKKKEQMEISMYLQTKGTGAGNIWAQCKHASCMSPESVAVSTPAALLWASWWQVACSGKVQEWILEHCQEPPASHHTKDNGQCECGQRCNEAAVQLGHCCVISVKSSVTKQKKGKGLEQTEATVSNSSTRTHAGRPREGERDAV